MEVTECSNCQSKIKKGMFGENKVIDDPNLVFIINKYADKCSDAYCTECCNKLLDIAYSNIQGSIKHKNRTISENVSAIPVLTTHMPLNWDYESISIVTAQTTTGTGVIAEFTSGFTDFFGIQSGAYNKKLVAGEDSCFSQLRYKALALGANAIIATDIDYAEVGGVKGMLMICMAGTAVKLKNTDILADSTTVKMNEMFKSIQSLSELEEDMTKYRNIPNI